MLTEPDAPFVPLRGIACAEPAAEEYRTDCTPCPEGPLVALRLTVATLVQPEAVGVGEIVAELVGGIAPIITLAVEVAGLTLRIQMLTLAAGSRKICPGAQALPPARFAMR